MSRITQILIAESPAAPMVEVASVLAVPGFGLQGDRYFSGAGTFSPDPRKPAFELTLIESEQIEAFAARSGLAFTAHMARRNIVTEGVDLNALVGVEFVLGPVRILGIRLCEPCEYLASISVPEVLPGLTQRAGLRAQILSEGLVSVGDAVRRVVP